MLRPILADDHIHPAVQAKVASNQQAIVKEVMDAVRGNDVVVDFSADGGDQVFIELNGGAADHAYILLSHVYVPWPCGETKGQTASTIMIDIHACLSMKAGLRPISVPAWSRRYEHMSCW